jgi:hypothetical protein
MADAQAHRPQLYDSRAALTALIFGRRAHSFSIAFALPGEGNDAFGHELVEAVGSVLPPSLVRAEWNAAVGYCALKFNLASPPVGHRPCGRRPARLAIPIGARPERPNAHSRRTPDHQHGRHVVDHSKTRRRSTHFKQNDRVPAHSPACQCRRPGIALALPFARSVANFDANKVRHSKRAISTRVGATST